jgi:rRNA processing protein Gar1
VVAVTAEGGLTLRGKELPVGTIIRDPKGRFTGRVVKVFGPVSNPYLSVRPRRSPSPENLLTMVGETMLIKED